VPTGWGSAVNAADVRPGETVVVYGIGGIGINAVQGARFAGAQYVIAVDPVGFKRETALALGATHATADADEAHRLVQELTRGVGAHKAVVSVGTVDSEVVDQAFTIIGKAGTVVLTSMGGGFRDRTIQLPAQVATLWKKTIKGSLFGDCNPTTAIPQLLGLYRSGDLRLDELITRRYTLEQVNEGYEDLLAGRNIRGVIVHEHG
jgi:S-(hydroxymethyl)glutathione dehydrogenase/alcohol dehydrogenase